MIEPVGLDIGNRIGITVEYHIFSVDFKWYAKTLPGDEYMDEGAILGILRRKLR
jgi:hypothetical protein